MKIYHQSTFDPWPLEDKSVQAIITSPPYWGLRKYDIPDIVIGGSPDCEHKWGKTKHFKRDRQHMKEFGERFGCGGGNKHSADAEKYNASNGAFCTLCGAWKGQYGLEPTFQLFIEHTLLWIPEAHRVLRDDGVFFLNLKDTYGGGWGGYSHKGGAVGYGHSGIDRGPKDIRPDFLPPTAHAPKKCKLKIPDRIAIAMMDSEEWIIRNDIIWVKENGMTESAGDRFSQNSENIFMFVKKEQYYFDLDAVRLPHSEASLKRSRYSFEGSGIPGEAYPRECRKNPLSMRLNPKGANPGNVWIINAQPSPIKHYAMWPEALVERMIRCSTRLGDTVLDPFCGSGRTVFVAMNLGRKGVGIDLGYGEIQEKVCGMFLNK